MRLKDLDLSSDILINDCEFDIWGLLTTKLRGKQVLSFIESEKYLIECMNPYIACVFCTAEMVEALPSHIDGIIISNNPRLSFYNMHNNFANKVLKKERTQIGMNCNISKQAYIAPFNVKIGNNVIIEEFVSIKENVEIKDNCIIRTGTVIGGEGYEFKRKNDASLMRVRHMGGVLIEEDVEMQQLNNVSKAVFEWDKTVVGQGTKIDSLVHIAHAVKIGRNCNIVASAMLGGGVVIGDEVWVGPNATVCNSLHIANKARISLGSVVTQNVNEAEVVTGNFAIEHSQFIKNIKKLV